MLFCFTVLRIVLFAAFRPEPAPPFRNLVRAFLIGFHLDVVTAVLLSLPLILWLSILPDRWFSSKFHRIFFKGAFMMFWCIQVFIFFAEYYFFDEFKSRFNTVAVDYLLYPHEVFNNIWDDYPVPKVLTVCVVFAGLLLMLVHQVTKRVWDSPTTGKSRMLRLAWALAIGLALAVSFSTRESRFSNERVLNEIANNGSIAFLTAAWTRNLDYAAFYRTLPAEEAAKRTRRLLAEPQAKFDPATNSIQRSIAGSSEKPKYNLVLLLEESLGSEFWGCLGQTNGLTPEMDKVANEEGMLFTNLYASGNRTVRGFEGVLSSFPPLPGDSIVKRNQSDNVETIARILQRDGYSTLFLYGGRGLFDGMRSFAMNNGYERFVEQKHFEKPTFTTIWGVCDEDLYDRSIEECRALAATGKPFFATLLTVSNHKPYTYPKGRIPEDPDLRRREHAVKYTDYALGRYFRALKKEAFYTNTLFVVVADHGARVYGSPDIPIHSYEIPMVLVGPAVIKSASRVGNLGCSLDVAPTILGLLGRPYKTMFFGRDLLHSPQEDGRVLINHNRDIGMFHDNHLVVLGINKTVQYYHGDPKKEEIQRVKQPDAVDLEVEQDAMALFQTADELYTHERYRVQERPD